MEDHIKSSRVVSATNLKWTWNFIRTKRFVANWLSQYIKLNVYQVVLRKEKNVWRESAETTNSFLDISVFIQAIFFILKILYVVWPLLSPVGMLAL